MQAGDLLVGNLAIASVVIKTLISSYKQMFSLSPMVSRISAVCLGIISAFILKAAMFSVPETSMTIEIFQRIIAGLFIGATAMGLHEGVKAVEEKTKAIANKK